ncbi:GNAT family N-acetyltransferase [Methanosarcina sp. MSH10X1]|uniref:GNAT family N-acetyltransferase n=1 Tax=Methanosarcina sp. MSH10X1 TaxID=2507075 RepID=UPI003514F70D
MDNDLDGVLEKWSLNNFSLDLPDKWELSFTAYVEGKAVGYMICSKKENNTHIHRIAICKEYQRMNIGNNLIRTLENRIGSGEKITLKVKKFNFVAIKFYKKNGFIIYGEEDCNYLYEKTVGDEIDKKGTCNECAS